TTKETLAYIDSVLPRHRGMLLDLYELLDGTAVQEKEGEIGRELVRRAAEEIAPIVAEVQQTEVLERRRALRWLKGLGGVAAVFVLASIPLREYLAIGCRRLFNPFTEAVWPHRTTITITQPAERDSAIPQLESFTVSGTVSGVIPPQLTLAYRDKTVNYWIRERITVRQKKGEGTFTYQFPEVRESLRFYVSGGDHQTPEYQVKIIQRPYLTKVIARYDYPDYAGIPDRTVESGQLMGLEGTRVRLEFCCSMPLEKALFRLNDGEAVPLKKKSDTVFETELMLEKDGQYAVELYEKHGYREAKPEVYDIRVYPDNAPEVEILMPGQDMIATKMATLNVAFRASDDFGLEKVQFLYKIDDGEPQLLSDRITGPIRQRGKTSEARFTWHLSNMQLPDAGVLRYYVRVKDINPTGRGVTESAQFQVKLVKPSEFHLDAIEKAKRLDTEARIAWENQLKAWDLGTEWLSKGTGQEDDPLWIGMVEAQNMSIRAARTLKGLLQELAEKYTQNNMSREFMSVRLNAIAETLAVVTDKLHPGIENSIQVAKPRTEAEAIPERLKAKRAEQLAKFKDSHKLAVLHLERVLEKLFDWRDLQITTVRTTLLSEEQAEVLKLTEKIAPRFIMLEIEDVSDEDQDLLLTLGKRQLTIFNVESELEEQLVYLKFKAEKQGRKSIQAPLDTAYKVLRDPAYRVNDNLKQAAKMIANNQPYQIVGNQKTALQALDIVKGGLIVAGQKVDKDPEITLAMTPNRDLGVIETEIKVAQKEPTEEPREESGEPVREQALTPSELLKALPVGSDALSTAIHMAWDLQDSVRARTKYLNENSGPQEMPRYVRLKQAILLDRQNAALSALDLAAQECQKAAKNGEVLGADNLVLVVADVKTEFQQSLDLIRKRALGPITQQIQSDSMATLKDMLTFVALEKQVRETVDENKKRNGEDAFGRKYLIRDKDLDLALGVFNDLNRANLLQSDILRKVKRLSIPATDPALDAVEKINRERTMNLAKTLAGLIKALPTKLSALTADVASRVKASDVTAAANIEVVAAADEKAALTHEANVNVIARAIQTLKDLLGERLKTAEQIAAETPVKEEPITAEEFAKRLSPEVLSRRLKESAELPAEIRDIMLRALEKGLPPKYEKLVAAYYSSFVKAEEKR
ncbi:MAG: hypothetical protein N2255_04640, partial [Kiritimatiellae bacterium]|nr:hypothetical protein [Kiritimatiellia bacterium]